MWNQKKRRTTCVKLWQSVREKQLRLPCALSEPRGAHHWCDNRCSDKALRSMLIASMVIEEGGEARTINLCKLWYTGKLVQQGRQPQKSKGWKEVMEKKAHRGRLWKIFGSEQSLRGMWEYFTLKSRKILADAAREKTRRNTVSMARRISTQSSFGASQKKCGY